VKKIISATQKREPSGQKTKNLFIIAGILLVLFLLNTWASGGMGGLLFSLKNPRLQLFTILLLAVLLEGFPFLLLGACISGIIEVMVPDKVLKGLFPENRFFAALIGSCLGLFFPVCSCGNIPVTRRLINKGVPVSGCIGYLLAAPIINPITIVSTFIAFPGNGGIVLSRLGLALLVAVAGGYMLGSPAHGEILRDTPVGKDACGCDACNDDEDESRLARILHHAEHDFFLTGKFLIIGASVACLFQTFLTRSALGAFAHHPVYSVILLGGMAMAFCLCSFADAFVASTFTPFSPPAKVAFMVAGPMANVALIILYLGTFKRPYAIRLILWIVASVFILSGIWGIIRGIT
jgi:uncharacterized protein